MTPSSDNRWQSWARRAGLPLRRCRDAALSVGGQVHADLPPGFAGEIYFFNFSTTSRRSNVERPPAQRVRFRAGGRRAGRRSTRHTTTTRTGPSAGEGDPEPPSVRGHVRTPSRSSIAFASSARRGPTNRVTAQSLNVAADRGRSAAAVERPDRCQRDPRRGRTPRPRCRGSTESARPCGHSDCGRTNVSALAMMLPAPTRGCLDPLSRRNLRTPRAAEPLGGTPVQSVRRSDATKSRRSGDLLHDRRADEPGGSHG